MQATRTKVSAVVGVAVRTAHPSRAFSSLYKDPNFPMTADGRVHHLDFKEGEVANRILSVGDHGRAERISELFDDKPHFSHRAQRGFHTYTGYVNGVEVSIIATGMGMPMMDMVVREARAVVDGPMAMFRLGTCGGLGDVVPGTLCIANQSVQVRREPDCVPVPGVRDGVSLSREGEELSTAALPYSVSLPVPADAELLKLFSETYEWPAGVTLRVGMNSTTDSFYSSQGRTGTAFLDANEKLLDSMMDKHPELISCEMETFHLLDLARSSTGGSVRAGGAAIALATRGTQSVIDADDLALAELEGGKAALFALSRATLEE